MKIIITGKMGEEIGSEVQFFEEYIEINYRTTEAETEFYTAEEKARKIANKIAEYEEELTNIKREEIYFENIDRFKKLEKELTENIIDIEELLKEHKRKENQSSFIAEEINRLKKLLKSTEIELTEVKRQIKEISNYGSNEEYEKELLRDIEKLTEEYLEALEEKKQLREIIQNEENNIQVIEHIIKVIKTKNSSYEIHKSNEQVKEDYYKLIRVYSMKNGENKSYENEFYDLDSFLQKFGVSKEIVGNLKRQENVLKRIRIKQMKEKKSLTGRISHKKSKRLSRQINSKKQQQEIARAEKELRDLKEELADIEKTALEKMKEKLKGLSEEEQIEEVNKLKENLKEEQLKREHPEAMKQLEEMENIAKAIEESIVRDKKIIEEQRENSIKEEAKKIKEEQILKELEEENKKLEELEKENKKFTNRVIDKISKVANKIFSFFRI